MERFRRPFSIAAALVVLTFAAAVPVSAALSTSGVLNVVKVSAGGSAVLFDGAQFKITARCLDNGGGNLTAQSYIETKHDNAMYFFDAGSVTDPQTFDLDFDVADGAVAFQPGTRNATGTSPQFSGEDYGQGVYAVSAGGKVLIARSATGVHVQGADCIFSGLYLAPDRTTAVIKVAAGQTATIFENAQFKITGTCIDNGGGNVTAQPYLETKTNNAMYFTSIDGNDVLDFDTGSRVPLYTTNPDYLPAQGTTPSLRAETYAYDLYAISAGGQALIARNATGVHLQGSDCIFTGLFQSGSQLLNVVKVAAGAGTTLFVNQQFKVTARCFDNGGGDLTARFYLKTRKDNAMYSSESGSDTNFDRSDGKIVFGDGEGEASGTAPQLLAYDDYQDVYALSATGKALIARVASGVHVLGAACIFSGLFEHA